MKMPRVLTGIILACGLAGIPPRRISCPQARFTGGASQIRVAFQVFNAGSIPITFVSTEIFDQLTPGGGPVRWTSPIVSGRLLLSIFVPSKRPRATRRMAAGSQHRWAENGCPRHYGGVRSLKCIVE